MDTPRAVVAAYVTQKLSVSIPLFPEVVAASPWLDLPLGRRLARFKRPEVWRKLAANRVLPPELAPRVVARAKAGGDQDVLLRNPAIPFDLLAAQPWAKDWDLLAHLGAPADYLARQWRAGDRRCGVDAVARHPNTPLEILLEAADGDDARLWDDLLRNPSLPTDVGRRLHAQLASTEHGARRGRYAWAGSPAADPDSLREFATQVRADRSGGDEVLHLLARNPATPADVLHDLADLRFLHHCLLDNPTTTSSTLARLMEDLGLHESVARRHAAVAAHPGVDRELLARCGVPVPVEQLADVVVRHAATAAQAQALLSLSPHVTGSVADLLDAAQAVTG